MMDLEKLTADIRAVCPVIAVNARGTTKAGIEVVFDPSATQQQRTSAQSVLDAFNENTPPPTTIPLDILQARIEAESAWDTYVNFMFGTATRRNAFVKTMFIGKPLRISGNGFITSLQGAGLTAQQIARITAPV